MNVPLKYEAFPLGCCPVCLDQWRTTGKPGDRHELGGDLANSFLLSGYCVHNETGFYTIVVDGVVRQWSMRSPVSIEEWKAYVNILPKTYAGANAAISATAGHYRNETSH